MNDIGTRFIRKDDLKRVREIDSVNKDEIEAILKGQNIINGVVAVNETDDVVGFCIYSMEKSEVFNILHLAVDKDFSKQIIGEKLINRMKSKLNETRNALEYDVPENDLELHLFLKSMQFKARAIRLEDAYIFRFTYMENQC